MKTTLSVIFITSLSLSSLANDLSIKSHEKIDEGAKSSKKKVVPKYTVYASMGVALCIVAYLFYWNTTPPPDKQPEAITPPQQTLHFKKGYCPIKPLDHDQRSSSMTLNKHNPCHINTLKRTQSLNPTTSTNQTFHSPDKNITINPQTFGKPPVTPTLGSPQPTPLPPSQQARPTIYTTQPLPTHTSLNNRQDKKISTLSEEPLSPKLNNDGSNAKNQPFSPSKDARIRDFIREMKELMAAQTINDNDDQQNFAHDPNLDKHEKTLELLLSQENLEESLILWEVDDKIDHRIEPIIKHIFSSSLFQDLAQKYPDIFCFLKKGEFPTRITENESRMLDENDSLLKQAFIFEIRNGIKTQKSLQDEREKLLVKKIKSRSAPLSSFKSF